MTTLLHTADWHLGKAYARFSDDRATQVRLQEARFEAVRQLADIAVRERADAVLVAGDLFHTSEVDDKTVVRALGCMGKIPVPIVAIPGNHDHSGPGSVYRRPSFEASRLQLCPQLDLVLDAPRLVPIGGVDVVAAPVTQRMHQQRLAALGALRSEPGRARVGLVHGSCREYAEGTASRALDLHDAASAQLAYLALGDYHRQQEVQGMGCRAFYAGALEPDGYLSHRQQGERAGGLLKITVHAGAQVAVEPLDLHDGMRWVRVVDSLRDGPSVDALLARLSQMASAGLQTTLCALDLSGSRLGYEDHNRLRQGLDRLVPHFLALEREGEVDLLPTPEELQALCSHGGIVGAAAQELFAEVQREGAPGGGAATAALELLHEAVSGERP